MLLNVNGVYNVRQTEIYGAEPLVPEPSAFEVDINVESLQRHKSPGTDRIATEFIKAVGKKIRNIIHKRINSMSNKEELPEEWKESIIVPIYKNGDKTNCSNYRGISLLCT
jgi:hypothetical protein